MKGISAIGLVALLCVSLPALGEEKTGGAATAPAAVSAKAGDKGEIVGLITAKQGGKVTVKGDAGELQLMPYWRGGAPKDGGAFDETTMKKLSLFKVGDKVRIAWTMEEHARIDSIKKAD
jgi:hypothetical protein